MIEKILTELETALKKDEPQQVRKSAAELETAIANLRNRESAVSSLARTVSATSADESAQKAAEEAELAADDLLSARSPVYNALYQYRTEQIDGPAAAEAVGELREALDEFQRAADALEEVRNEVPELPAIVVARTEGTDIRKPLGSEIKVTTVVENVGKKPTGPLSVAANSTAGSFSVETQTIGPIASNDSASVTATGSPNENGTVTIRFQSDEQVRADADLRFSVYSKQEYIGVVLTDIRDLFTRLFDLIPKDERPSVEEAFATAADRNNSEGRADGGRNTSNEQDNGPLDALVEKLTVTIKQLVNVFADIENDRPEGRINGQLTACGNRIEAFKNQVEAQTGKTVPERTAAELNRIADEIEEELNEATEAEIRE